MDYEQAYYEALSVIRETMATLRQPHYGYLENLADHTGDALDLLDAYLSPQKAGPHQAR